MTRKIWLSIAVFVLGYVISVGRDQIDGVRTEGDLRVASEALFPAAQRTQQAEAAFQRAVKLFSDAVMVQDAGLLDGAVNDARSVVDDLSAAAAVGGLPAERSAEARALANSLEAFYKDADATYRKILANPANLNRAAQEHIKELAGRTDTIKAKLQTLRTHTSEDLKVKLAELQDGSARQRKVALWLFTVTLGVAILIVNLTIRRSITGPIQRVIEGVRSAADNAATASDEMSRSGEVVARDAQEQAACVEETSASLEEISATTRENANRAAEADRLMSDARTCIEDSMKSMDNLEGSMKLIAQSSKELAAVLKSLDEIAFNTNILALNAAVEAARAGEAGAGFSVVAGEVRSLAQRAAEAARHSAGIVEKTIGDVGKGVELVSTTHAGFRVVSERIVSGGEAMSRVAVTCDEQARGIAQIGQAVARIQAVTQSNAANAQRTAASAEDMIAQVEATRNHLDELSRVVGVASNEG
jgi:methyl-accepting chemotaxis protein